MKKVLLLLVSVFVLTACGNNGFDGKLTCTRVTTESGFELSAKNTVVVKNRKVSKNTIELITKADEGTKDYIDYYAEQLESSFVNVKDMSGITYSAKTDDGKHTLKLIIDYSKLKESEIETLSITEKELLSDREVKNASVTATKEELEKEGYTCKIK